MGSILSIISSVLSLLRTLANWIEGAKQREEGRNEANAETLRKNSAQVDAAMKAEVEADKGHKTMPGDEAFDNDFRRD